MKIKRIILSVAAVALLGGCFKSVSHKTTYALKPTVQETDGETTVLLKDEDVVVYGYAADTSEWGVRSYADALAGTITAKKLVSGTKTPDAKAEPDSREGFEDWLSMPLDMPQAMILAVDTKHKVYGYTQQIIGENMPEISVVMVFKPWMKGFSYKVGNWQFFFDDYVPPKQLKCTFTPMLQSLENTEPVASTSTIRAYVYAADTTEWRIASYEDAEAGIITSKQPPIRTRTNPNFSASKGTDGTYSVTVEKEVLMVVVVDRTNGMYAYCKQTVDLDAEAGTFPEVVFRPWKKEVLYEEAGGWRVVNESNANPEPESKKQR
ncbi:hypothetical protein [uncultured Alistipes sp.]|jgi:hypothetical protein|uniref:hypothetical protein n=1 Tax=uncultured Alistipes sp. TaxID=538949 RepID=UPI0025DE285A|nr:hypothetical protein [uncultured Alistipes sp.]